MEERILFLHEPTVIGDRNDFLRQALQIIKLLVFITSSQIIIKYVGLLEDLMS